LRNYGEFRVGLESVRLLLERAARLFDEAWKRGDALDEQSRGYVAVAIATAKVAATRVGLDLSSRLFDVAGPRATHGALRLDRFWRNLRTQALHDPVDYKLQEPGFAHWIPVLALDEQDQAVLAFVKQGAPGLTVVDDWSGFGQRTTASGTVIAENVRVSSFEIFHTQRSYDRPTFAGPFAQITTAAIDLGIARAAPQDTITFVQQHARPWIDSGVARAAQDPLTVVQIGDIAYRIHAAEALLERSGRFVDIARREPSEETVARAAIAVGEAKIATTEISLLAASKLFELGGSKSTLAKYNFDRHWRNARVHTLHDPVRWKYHAIGNYYLNGIKPARHSWN
jgi:alkylation response protein AidB-like acyl-CoA dehydrogenase